MITSKKHFLSLILVFGFVSGIAGVYVPPINNRAVYNLNYDWKFNKANVANSQAINYDDSGWKTVTLPHTFNDVDHFDTYITGSGDGCWQGITWYRKHFNLDASQRGRNVFIEFEGFRQAAEIYINGTLVGRHENGVGPCGVDISAFVNFGTAENIIAVKVDNNALYREVATGVDFQWASSPFNPIYGGIVSNVRLHVTDKLYQTLPLYSNLKTSGNYVYASNINIGSKTADITVESEVKNSYATSNTIDYIVVIVDINGNELATKTVTGNTFSAGETKKLITTLPLSNIKFWSPNSPNLYRVFTQLKRGANAIDVTETTFGVRKLGFNVANGLTLNDQFLYLKGYAPRTTMEWVGFGIGPNWTSEYDFNLMKESNANFIRPMHVAPRLRDVESADKLGVIYAAPAGDGEADQIGRRWEQRVELMRDITIYFRNNPSVLFWEGGNQYITPAHMKEMVDLRKLWDPNGGRLSGTRSIASDLAGIQEYGSSMDIPASSSTIPVWDGEYARFECPRRVWDKYSPPSFGYKNIANPLNIIDEYPVSNSFKYNSSEDLARDNVQRYNDRWKRRGGQGLNAVMCGGAKIIFADGVSHGRMISTELARVTGSVDAARLPKEAFFALKAAQSDTAELEILGHWTYPIGTKKTIYVISNMDEVGLSTYDESGALIKDYGRGLKTNGFEFSFADVAWMPGKIVATGYRGGKVVKSKQILTAGTATKLKITPILGPNGFIADGNDIAMFDIEVVDAKGIRLPTQEGKLSFTYSGQANYLGGYNSGIQNSNYKDTLRTECGINRVFARATRTAGSFTLNVTSAGLTPASVTINSTGISVINGLSTEKPQGYNIVPKEPDLVPVFNLVDVIEAEPNTVVTSTITTVSNVLNTQPISIIANAYNASYSINGGSYVSTPGIVSNGDKITVRVISDAQYSTTRSVTIDIGGTQDVFSVSTKKQPPVQLNLAYNKPITSSEIDFITGSEINKINDGIASTRWLAAQASFPKSFVIDLLNVYNIDSLELLPYLNRDYRFLVEGSLDNSFFYTLTDQTNNTTAGATIAKGFAPQKARYVRVKITGAATYSGTYSSFYEFRLFEAQADTVPDKFNIIDQADADLFSYGISTPFTVKGIEGNSTISLSNSTEVTSYSINNGPFITEPSKVKNNDVIRIKLGTGSIHNEIYTVLVTIGGVSETFTIKTKTVTAIDELDSELQFYPNPTEGIVYVSGENGVSEIDLFTSSGNLVKTVSLTAANQSIDIKDFPKGIYMIRYKNNSKVIYSKILLR